MKLLLCISLIIGLSYSLICNETAVQPPTIAECEKLTDDNGCVCSCVSDDGMTCNDKEGCDITICPTTTPQPFQTSSTTGQISTTTTDIPTTTTDFTTTDISTTCICPPYTPPTNTGTSAPKSKDGKSKGSSGIGIGECDCKDGVVELRYVYTGTTPNVQIDLYTGKKDAELVCSYENVQPNQEIVCNLRGDAPGTGLIKEDLYKFATESPFTITYPNGNTCEAQYHTSCSQDIVGVIQEECDELVVSGWKDNQNYENGGDCDDGIPPCTCDEAPPIKPPKPTGTQPITTFGEICYCSTGNSSSTTSTTSAPKSKGKKSKGKKSKGKKKGGDGLGVGDCDCEGGQLDLTIRYEGDKPINIECIHKDGGELNRFKNVQTGQEVTCSVAENDNYEKLGTETIVNVFDRSGGNYCETQIHTSCSRDIVGTFGEGTCGEDIVVTGWRDVGNINDGGECDDGFEPCPCTTTSTDSGAPALVRNEKDAGNNLKFLNGNTDFVWYFVAAIVVVIIIVLIMYCYCRTCLCSFWCDKEYKPEKIVDVDVENSMDDEIKETDGEHLTVQMIKV